MDWHVPHDGNVVVLIVHQSLWLVLGPFVYNLDIMIFADPPVEIYTLQLYCAWRCIVFWLMPHVQIQYGPQSLHFVNTFSICSPFASHMLLSGSFWCLLSGLKLLPAFLVQLSYFHVIIYYYVPVEASLPFLRLALAHFSSPKPIPISSLNRFTVCQFSNLFLVILVVQS